MTNTQSHDYYSATLQDNNINESLNGLEVNELSEEAIYWEPADDVNELYHQLSTNKYREIKSSQLK